MHHACLQRCWPHPVLLAAAAACIYVLSMCVCLLAGMWYHLSTFLDDTELGVAYATVTTASALSAFVGGPVAALLLSMNGFAGLKGWQWYVPPQAGLPFHQDAGMPAMVLSLPGCDPSMFLTIGQGHDIAGLHLQALPAGRHAHRRAGRAALEASCPQSCHGWVSAARRALLAGGKVDLPEVVDSKSLGG